MLSQLEPTRGALVVVMNRDERRDRPPARPPRRWRAAEGGFTAPVDGEAGGTWIAAAGLRRRPRSAEPSAGARRPRARRAHQPGRLMTALAAEQGLRTRARLRGAGLRSFAPFRLFVAAPAASPRVFTWNGVALTSRRLDPRLGFLTSSSWNPRAVIPARQARFRAFRRAHPRPTRDDLVAFHERASDPRGTPWAICMSRGDARRSAAPSSR